ncbi:Pectinesterase-2 precursor, putative [Ricinus communis]|uniref:Pectinesterase n=2 Tax=Ricinus communis TaxID=3988 RepID=B9SA40_RICCO|nr:Pectinesterase-2 precursor, putative [Ricinus communis]|eukprot:XP_002522859.1 pectinesterase [Ricinus communis]
MPSSIHQPMLNPSSSNANVSSKIFICFLFLSTIMFSSIFLAPYLITFSHSKPIAPASVCDRAHEPQACLRMVSEAVAADDGVQELNGVHLLKTLLIESLPQMRMGIESAGYIIRRTNDHKDKAALADCLELMDLSIDRVNHTLAALANWGSKSDADDAHTWLSGVLTNHVTCLDGIVLTGQQSIKNLMQDLISRTRTSLAVLASLSASNKGNLRPLSGGFPWWIRVKDRKILGSSSENIQANVVVAQDGSGDYSTIQEAVASAPDKSKTRYVIYVKKGTYIENVEIAKKKKNLMIFGDGMNLTIITGSLNVADGSTTFRSATLAVAGDGFILQDVWVQNTAGPEKHQAVALRVSADQAVINRCQIDAFQDTLYAHSYRQFYRDCYILGTIDFIFGNAAVVLQKCEIIARKPMSHQKNMVTAQGRVDPNQNTGISIQDCRIIPGQDLEPVPDVFPTYLGRPWKEYSRTVVMESYIDKHIDPAGWAEWNKEFALSTLYYGEYANRGPGAGTSKRVNWDGFHVITDPIEARKFTVAELIQGGAWLSSTGVSFTEGL